jgi:DNA-binding NtrC family response regulator
MSYASPTVLLVDDEIEILKSFEITLRAGGIKNVMVCQDSRNVLHLLSRQEVGVLLLDLTMPFISGEELLSVIVQDFPDIPVIVITGNSEVDTAVQCMKAGAFDYMVKPAEKSRLVSGVRRAIDIWELQHENQVLKERMLTGRLENPGAFSEIITNNKSMASLFQYVEAVAPSPQPVLVTGETGVGKELMAKAIHTLSNRPGSFVSVNVAGIDDNIFSDTLFGHVKGAFTGADQIRKGLVETAAGGTLLLDEIGDLKPDSQAKLLRLLQEREYFPLGSDLSKITDARVIVTTNQDLKVQQKSGCFRKDLYYRLHLHSIHIPPLRERLDDLSLLVDHFLETASHALGKKKPSLPDELALLLFNYHFPGNIRELQSMIYDAVSNNKSTRLSMDRFKVNMNQERSMSRIDMHRFSPENNFGDFSSGSLPTLEQANKSLIEEAMKRSRNNQSMAARLLGISRQRLARHLKNSRK